MPLHSKNKGDNGERELARELTKIGLQARRGQQFKGTEDSPDVETCLENTHIECKRVERLNLHNAMAQSRSDAGSKIPVVMHRKNREEWLVTVPLDSLIDFAKDVLSNVSTETGIEVSTPPKCHIDRMQESLNKWFDDLANAPDNPYEDN